ncbi:MAG: Lrp/AsnC family transcriptional regulator [Methanomassiliicoccales archaeon]
MRFDTKDKIIISMYAEDPDVSQESIGKKINLSQPSVAARIAKLKEAGALSSQLGINPLKMGLYLAKVDVSSTRPDEILGMFRGCPYFANGFTISGKNNLCLLFFSESIATLESIVNGHIRSNSSVSDVDFNIVITSERDYIVPSALNFEHSDHPPCGIKLQCRDCLSFKSVKCMGCPVTGQYQGTLY